MVAMSSTQAARRRAVRVALLVVGCCATAIGKDARTALPVSATVTAVTRLEWRALPEALVVSAADATRGAVDVLDQTAFVVNTNSRAGVALDIAEIAPVLTGLEIYGLGTPQRLGADGGTLALPWRGAAQMAVTLTFHMELVPGLPAGRYPWPLRVTARPLEAL